MAKDSALVIEGLEALQAGLNKLELFAEKTVLKDALKEGAKVVADEAKTLAPVKSGQLQRAIRVRAGRSRRGVMSVLASVGKKWFSGETFYGAFQEFGWHSGKRSNSFAAQHKRIVRQLRTESRRARDGKGAGLAAAGTEFRKRQEAFFRDEAARRIYANKGGDRAFHNGEHFMQTAFEEKAQEAMSVITQAIRNGIERELGSK